MGALLGRLAKEGCFSPTGPSPTLVLVTENQRLHSWDFPGGAVVKNLPANAGDTGSSPGPGRSQVPQSS